MKKFFKNEKGFTLVELVVVVAVLAVIAVLASPKLIEYVEKSRQGTDRNAVREVAHAVQVAYVDIKKDNPNDTKIILSIDSDGNASYKRSYDEDYMPFAANDNTQEGLVEALREILAEDSYVYKSKLYRNSEIAFIVTPADGNVTISTGDALVAKEESVEKAQRAVEIAQQAYNIQYDVVEGLRTVVDEAENAIPVLENLVTLAQKAVDNAWFGKDYLQGKLNDAKQDLADGKAWLELKDAELDDAEKALKVAEDDLQAARDLHAKELEELTEQQKGAGTLQEHIDQYQ